MAIHLIIIVSLANAVSASTSTNINATTLNATTTTITPNTTDFVQDIDDGTSNITGKEVG